MRKLLLISLLAFIYTGMALPAGDVNDFHRGAAQGNAGPMSSLGWCYEHGDGVEVDLREAVRWYKAAAECIGALKRVSSSEYDLQGRIVKSTDVPGRITRTAYSENGLKTTITTPAGAQLISLNNLAGSLIEQCGDGWRGLRYVYDYEGGLRTTQLLLSSGEMLARSVENGYDETILSSVATTVPDVSLDTVSTYNNKGQLIQTQEGALAPTTYAYDSMGNIVRQTRLLNAAAPESATGNVIVKQELSYEMLEDGVFQVLTTQRNNAEGAWLASVRKSLASQLSPRW